MRKSIPLGMSYMDMIHERREEDCTKETRCRKCGWKGICGDTWKDKGILCPKCGSDVTLEWLIVILEGVE